VAVVVLQGRDSLLCCATPAQSGRGVLQVAFLAAKEEAAG